MQNTFNKHQLNAHVNVSIRLLYERRGLKKKKEEEEETEKLRGETNTKTNRNKLSQNMLKRAITILKKLQTIYRE